MIEISESGCREQRLGETSPLLGNRVDVENPDDCGVDASVKSEFKLITRHSLPLIGTYLLQYSYNVILVFVVSHLGTKELASVSIGMTTMNITGYSIFEGLSTSLDTLCSQSYGSGNYKQVGVYVQQSFLFLLQVTIPIVLLWVFSPFIFLHFINDHDVAMLAGTFLRFASLSLPGYAAFEAGKRFLQAQGDFKGGLVALIISMPVLIFFNWLFVYKLRWSLVGAALAIAISTTVRPLVLLLYINFKEPWTLQCWPGLFAAPVFRSWMPMIRLSLPGAVMTVFEWLAFEIMTLSTSSLGTVPLAAQSVLVSVTTILWHIPFPVTIVMATRIGFLMGKNSLHLVKRFMILYGAIFVFIGLFNACISLFGRDLIPRIFGTERDVGLAITANFPFAALFQAFDSLSCFVLGVVRGLGRQSTGAWITLTVNYLYAVPLSIILELGVGKFSGLGLPGVWIGLASGQALMTATVAIFLAFITW